MLLFQPPCSEAYNPRLSFRSKSKEQLNERRAGLSTKFSFRSPNSNSGLSDFSCIISLFSHPLTLTFVLTFQTRIWLRTELKRFWGWVQGGDARHCIAWEEQELWKWWLCGRFGWWWGVQVSRGKCACCAVLGAWCA